MAQTTRRYNSIHRQQLFYWTGRGLDVPSAGQTAIQRLEQRRAYVDRLESILEKGIWLKVPEKPDQLGDGTLIRISRPIACFTEWSLGQSLAHTSEYGRLGLGFSKRFILSCGGQPVIYVRDAQTNARYVSALTGIARALNDGANKIPPHIRESLRQHFDFISHFVKAIQKPRKVSKKTKKPSEHEDSKFYQSAEESIREMLELAASEDEKRFTRKFGRFLHYLEEREWRIVYDKALERHFKAGPSRGVGPDYYLPIAASKGLFTVVVPDQKTASLVMQSRRLRNMLFPKEGPQVTLLSLTDIGTF
jgi:Putative abortive phage resistance protein AbiGi, antitoxin